MPRPPSITFDPPTQGELRVMWADAEIDELGTRTVQAAVIGTSAQTIERWLRSPDCLHPPAWIESWLDLWRELSPDAKRRIIARRLGLSQALADQ